ncbi:TPA: LysR family transcriptional regulator AmpR, partial [Klebsiella pneumoniae]|nr:LysR family transcriptional regulator AmpR [Klebsiella pneumoniae]
MVRRYLPLNPLRAFEAAARHLSFTRAAIELNVTHAAVSQQVRALEEQLGCVLFTRVSRGLVLTHEGEGLLPVLNEAFDRIADTLECFSHGQFRERVKVGAVGTFAAGWLLPRLAGFYDSHPHIDLHISTHNNHVDPAAEGHDYTIRFGNGAWHESDAELIFSAPHAPLCSPAIAEQLQQPDDVHRFTLLRSFRRDEWSRWLDCAGGTPPSPSQPVMVFDTSLAMAEAAQLGAGVAIAPVCMFSRLLQSGAL